MKQSILVVDDDAATRFGFSRYLAKSDYAVKEASSLGEARETITSQRFDAVILDQRLPDGNGIDWISDLRGTYPDISIVVITGVGDIPLAVDAMRRGADNFMTKPVNMADLDVFLRKSLEIGALRRRHLTQQRLVKKIQPYFGKSRPVQKVMDLASMVAEKDHAVLLLGETGTGKGVLARWIHEHGMQSAGPFVEINCSSLRGDLLSSELFGHAKGAFTSAVQDRQGLIEVADGGTLFLDEIGDMDIPVQAQFLKVIEEKCYRRLGEVAVRQSNFRLICATNKNLSDEVLHGRFRQDLYYRIQVFSIRMPPLREMLEDIPDYIRHIFLTLQSSLPNISSEALSLLTAYPWPGNIRELKNVLERALLLSRGGPLEPEHFPGMGSSDDVNSGAGDRENIRDLDQLEESYIKSVIERFGGDREKAADALGVSRATLYRKLKKFRQSSR